MFYDTTCSQKTFTHDVSTKSFKLKLQIDKLSIIEIYAQLMQLSINCVCVRACVRARMATCIQGQHNYLLSVFNIMVLSDWSVRIIDFGNSKNIADPEAKPHLDLDCVVSVFLKILKLIPSKKKSSTEDKRLDKLVSCYYLHLEVVS